MRHTPPRFRTALATAAVLLATAPAAEAGAARPYAGQRFVFLLQGQVRSADGLSGLGRSIIGRLVFDDSGTAGSFTLTSTGAEDTPTHQEQGRFACLPAPQLARLLPHRARSSGLSMLAVRDHGAPLGLAQRAQTALTDEAGTDAAWDALPLGACDLWPGKAYIGRYGGEADAVAAMGLSQWRFDTRWSALPTPSGHGALLSVNNGDDGYLVAYPSADGSVARIHAYAGRGAG